MESLWRNRQCVVGLNKLRYSVHFCMNTFANFLILPPLWVI